MHRTRDGSEIVTCELPEAGFLNDLIEYKGYLYVTDSKVNQFFVFDAKLLVHGKCEYSTIPFPYDGFSGDGFPYSNGIEIYKGGLIISTIGGALPVVIIEMAQFWYVGLVTGEASPMISGAIGDGLLVDGDIFYAGDPLNSVSGIYELDCGKMSGVTATKLDESTLDLFVGPSTVTQYKDWLYALNLVRTFTARSFQPLSSNVWLLTYLHTLFYRALV